MSRVKKWRVYLQCDVRGNLVGWGIWSDSYRANDAINKAFCEVVPVSEHSRFQGDS